MAEREDNTDSMTTSCTTAGTNGAKIATTKTTDTSKPIDGLVRPLRPAASQVFDPFRHPHPLKLRPLYLEIPLFLLGLVLLPIRFVLAAFLFFQSFLVSVFVAPNEIRHIFPYYARAILFVIGFHKINRIFDDDPNPTSKQYTIISNHTSMIDPAVCLSEWCPGFVAKASIKHVPIIGPLAQAVQSLFVDRMNGAARVARLISQRQTENGPRLVIYPEGTTTNGQFLLKFKTGAFIAGAPVVPVIIRYPYTTFSPTYDTIRWWKFVIKLLMEPCNRVEYIQMPVYYPSEEEKRDCKLYAENVRKLMAKRANLTLSDSTFQDKLEFHHVVRGDPLPKHLKND